MRDRIPWRLSVSPILKARGGVRGMGRSARAIPRPAQNPKTAYRRSIPSSPNVAAISSAEVSGFTRVSIFRILPSLPM